MTMGIHEIGNLVKVYKRILFEMKLGASIFTLE